MSSSTRKKAPMVSDRIVNIIEDHESIVQTLDGIVCSMENGLEMPNFVPVLHDTVVTDNLSRIIVWLKEKCHEA